MKKMVNNKKGQALSLNTIVIAVIVVVVLIVVVSFFLFGFQGLTDRVKTIFFGTTAGTDQTLAIQQCNNFCDQLELLPSSAERDSPYCKFSFNIDTDNDGEAQFVSDTDPKEFVNYYCNFVPSGDPNGRSLGVSCSARRGQTTENIDCK